MREIGLFPRIVAVLSFLSAISLSCSFYSTFMFHLFNEDLLRTCYMSDTVISLHTGVNSTSMGGDLIQD